MSPNAFLYVWVRGMNGPIKTVRAGAATRNGWRQPRTFRSWPSLIWVALMAVLFLGNRGSAATIAQLHTFTGSPDGAFAHGGLIQAPDGLLYGTTVNGGANVLDADQVGTIYRVSPTDTGYEVLRTFNSATDGGFLYGSLLARSEGMDIWLYGTAFNGGAGGKGTIFRLKSDGTGFEVLHDFNGTDGSSPFAGLKESNGFLYGTTQEGGTNGDGTIFSLRLSDFLFTKLYDFNNSLGDGGDPVGGVIPVAIDAETFLYGTTFSGGGLTYGTIFRYGLNGTGFEVMRDLDGTVDGGSPQAGLILGSDGALYGTTYNNGIDGGGTLFRLGTNSIPASFTVVYNFEFATTGGLIYAGVVEGPGGVLYGATSQGGALGAGTIYQINRDGSAFETLITLGAVAGGVREPRASVVFGLDGKLYGTTYSGGSLDLGTVYSINITEGPLGLVARWGFEPTSPAALVPDLSLSGNIGTYVGAGAPQPGGKSGSRLPLTGANYMSAATRQSINFGTSPFAGEAWVRWSNPALNQGDSVLIEKLHLTPVVTNGWWFGLTAGSALPLPGKLTLRAFDSAFDTAPMEWETDNAVVPSDGEWHLVGFSYDPTLAADLRTTFYLDGEVVTSFRPSALDFIPNVSSPTELRLGVSWESPTLSMTFAGDLDEVRLFRGTHASTVPVVGVDSLIRRNNTQVAKVLKSTLLANDLGALGTTLTVTAVSNPTPPGASVSLNGSFVVYTAPSNLAGDGTFTYTVSDGTHTADVTVSVIQLSVLAGAGSPNAAKITKVGDDFVIRFLGVPGRSYRVQYTTSTAAPYDWVEFSPAAVLLAPYNGVLSYTDVSPVGATRLYRVIANP